MKKYIAIFCCILTISAMNVFAQQKNPDVKKGISSNTEQAILNKTVPAMDPADEPKKVFMHYMGWFGPDSLGIHWKDGQPRKPIIGYYNSQSWATQMYHILLSWSCGIDGLVINVKDTFDTQSLKMLTPTLTRIRDIDSTNFNYQFAISYDDQGMVNLDTAKSRFTFLKESILPNNPSYLRYNDTAVVFIYNYKLDTVEKIPEYLTAPQYKMVIDSVFTTNPPKVLWNEIEAPEIAYSYYSWVKADPVWEKDGSNWGKKYLYWYDSTLAITSDLDFATMGVWPGFNDTVCSWGKHRWIDRQKGAVYDSTWDFIQIYNDLEPTPALPMKWAYIETWNDWNEGSEIEPSEEYGYQYLISTIKNINTFKYQKDSIKVDTLKFWAARKIYEAAKLIELGQRASSIYYPILENAIKSFVISDLNSAITYAIKITTVPSIKDNLGGIEIYPNPVEGLLYIRQEKAEPYSVQFIHIQGKVMLYKEGKMQVETIDVSQFPKGIYLVRVKRNKIVFEGKIVVP